MKVEKSEAPLHVVCSCGDSFLAFWFTGNFVQKQGAFDRRSFFLIYIFPKMKTFHKRIRNKKDLSAQAPSYLV
jgi:hypothetical protein